MRIVLFCEHQYAISILQPIQTEAERAGEHRVLWFTDQRNISDFPLKDSVNWTNSIQEIYDFSPEAIFVPGNIVPYYLPGVKIQVFHGYAAEKKDHWVIRRYFDTYFTQGPFFTKGFQALARKYRDFEVVETGWPRQDWIYANLHSFDKEKEELLKKHQKERLVLYAPTFSPSLTSLPYLESALRELADQESIVLMIKLHPLTRKEWADAYKQLADSHPDILWMDQHNITKFQLMADIMISDTSSTIYEFLLLDKPVITFRATGNSEYWLDIQETNQLSEAFRQSLGNDEYKEKRRWIIDNYDPYLDGKVAQRMLNAAQDYIARKGVPQKRKLNLWRKYTSIKTFGKIN